jgi:hypothetical protein
VVNELLLVGPDQAGYKVAFVKRQPRRHWGRVGVGHVLLGGRGDESVVVGGGS